MKGTREFPKFADLRGSRTLLIGSSVRQFVNSSVRRFIVSLVFLLGLCTGRTAPVFDTRPSASGSASALSWDLDGDASYVGSGELRRGSERFGDITEIEASFDAIAAYQVNDKFILRLGAEWQRFSFDPNRSAPVPETLENVNLVLGADLQVTSALLMRIDFRPGLAGEFSHLSTGNFFVPIQIGGSYFVSPQLLLIAGIQINYENDIPVFPGAGLRWQVTPKFLVNAIVPKPTFEYQIADKVTAFVGANLLGGTFRVGDRYGQDTGIRKINHGVLEYTEIRAGGGLTWKVNRGFNLSAEVGCVPYRKFDYPRADYKVLATDVSPYLQISFSGKF
jgi:Domain of unknown function (DUF6268)